MRKYCVKYLYGEVWFFLLFSSSKGAPVLVALWDFPVSTDNPSTQIPKQSVPIGLVHSFVWSGPPACLGLTEVPLPAPSTTWHSPRHRSSEVSWMPQPRAWPEVSPLTWPAPPTSRLFRSVKREESVFPVLVVWILASFCRGFPTCQERRTLLSVVTEVLSSAATTLPTLPLSPSVLLLCQLGRCSTARN